jgi:hypothetical protein
MPTTDADPSQARPTAGAVSLGSLMTNGGFWVAALLALIASSWLGGAVVTAFELDRRSAWMLLPLTSAAVLGPLSVAARLHWRAWSTAAAIAGLHGAAWLLLSSGFYAWSDAARAAGMGVEVGVPHAAALAVSGALALIALPLAVSTILGPALALVAGDLDARRTMRRLGSLSVRSGGGTVLMFVTACAAAYGALVAMVAAAFVLGGTVVVLLVSVLGAVFGLAAFVLFAATAALTVTRVTADREPRRVPRVVTALLFAAALVAAAGLGIESWAVFGGAAPYRT